MNNALNDCLKGDKSRYSFVDCLFFIKINTQFFYNRNLTTQVNVISLFRDFRDSVVY